MSCSVATPSDEVLVETVTENLWFMPAGTVELAGRPALAKDPRLATALDDLERQFDHLIFDLPAVLATSDAIALARFADVYALVVRYGVTTIGTGDVGARRAGRYALDRFDRESVRFVDPVGRAAPRRDLRSRVVREFDRAGSR